MIGVISQPLNKPMREKRDEQKASPQEGGIGIESATVEKDENAPDYPADATGYISANYIDWLEASGAKTMPIAYNEPNEITD